MAELHRRHPTSYEPGAAVLVVALEGWIDAGQAAATAAGAVASEAGLEVLATFDDDALIDYRARRPTVHLREGVTTDIEWPTLTLAAGHDPEGHGVLLLSGPEPDMRWRAFTAEVLDLAVSLGAHTVCGLGAYPMTVPHTRPSRLAATSPDAELVRRLALEQGTVDLPAGMSSLLEFEAHRRGLAALTLWAQVPHYASSMAYPGAALALLEGLGTVTGVHIAGEAARAAALTTKARITELVNANNDHVAMLHQLEEQYDAAQRATPDGPLPSGDELAAELERYLRDQPD